MFNPPVVLESRKEGRKKEGRKGGREEKGRKGGRRKGDGGRKEEGRKKIAKYMKLGFKVV